MVIKYCEFEPTQHRNKRVAPMVFLDEPDDPHPLAICDVCSKKLMQMRPEAVVKDRKEYEAERKKARKEAAAAPQPETAAPEAEGAEPEMAPEPAGQSAAAPEGE